MSVPSAVIVTRESARRHLQTGRGNGENARMMNRRPRMRVVPRCWAVSASAGHQYDRESEGLHEIRGENGKRTKPLTPQLTINHRPNEHGRFTSFMPTLRSVLFSETASLTVIA